MAKTIDNISEASATNYLFLFAQRTLALQNEPPTPPPFNVLGLPWKGVCLLWATVPSGSRNAVMTRARALAGSGADNPNAFEVGSPNRPSDEAEPREDDNESRGKLVSLHLRVEPSEQGVVVVVVVVAAANKEKTFAQKIAPLAEKITEYINDHQDDAAQEERWRSIMKRETMKRFREQREAIAELRDTQGEAIAEMLQAIDKQREAIRAEVREAVDKQCEATAEVRQLIMELSNAYTNADRDAYSWVLRWTYSAHR